MKQCPKCGQSFADPDLNFCLNDGELLMQSAPSPFGSPTSNRPVADHPDDSPPTLMMNDPRATNPTGWTGSSVPAQWGGTTPAYDPPQFGMQNYRGGNDQTLPIVSLVMGIVACLMVCCYGGIWLGLPAAIVGFIGMRHADSDPQRYGGKGFAIAGLILGIVTFLISMMILIFAAIGSIS